MRLSNKASMLDSIIDKIASYLAQYFDLFLNFANKIAVFDMLFAFSQVERFCILLKIFYHKKTAFYIDRIQKI